MPANLSVDLCGVTLRNPIVMASGILGVGPDLLLRIAAAGAGGVVPKSCSLEARSGHANPTVLDYEWGLINAVGLSNPGVAAEVDELSALTRLLPAGCAFIASVFESTAERFAEVAAQIDVCRPHLIELNISCPNTESDLGRMFAADAADAAAVVGAVKRRIQTPIVVKLSPNVTDIAEIARACEAAGADALACINTVGPGMVIDIESAQPILTNRTGGVSGPAILPIAVARVYEVCRAVSIPVIGIGGVVHGTDAIQLVMAGATAVGVGSAAWFRRDVEPTAVWGTIATEVASWLDDHGLTDVDQVRGAALRPGGVRALT